MDPESVLSKLPAIGSWSFVLVMVYAYFTGHLLNNIKFLLIELVYLLILLGLVLFVPIMIRAPIWPHQILLPGLMFLAIAARIIWLLRERGQLRIRLSLMR